MFRFPRRLMLPIDSDAAPGLWIAGIRSEADVWRWYCGGVDVHRPSNGVFVDFFGHADGCVIFPPPTQSKVNKASFICSCIALYCWKGGESFFITVIFHSQTFSFWSCHYFVNAASVCYCVTNSCFDWLYSQQQWQIQARLQKAIILILQALTNKKRLKKKISLWFNYTFTMSAWGNVPRST